ncbi:ArsR family transcriptional regulator [Haloterrigena salinisoli]|uniref:DUF7344 domain-containing protein n=1 Tax=Haloterrigena salinisoli TaxID=3132747 RepID=UPI0030D1E9ED
MLPVISDPDSLTPVSAGATADGDGAQFGVLADRRRRAVLRYLDARDEESVSLSDLADHLVLEDDAEAGGALASCGDALFGTRRRVAITLRHSHVPKLADAGAVAFDHETNTVALREEGRELLARAETIDESDTDADADGGAESEANQVGGVAETPTP